MKSDFDGELLRNKGLQPALTEDWIGYLNLQNARALALADVAVLSRFEAEITLNIYWPRGTGRGECESVLKFNQSKQSTADPDLHGNVVIDGQRYRLGAWVVMPTERRKGFKLRLCAMSTAAAARKPMGISARRTFSR